MDIGGPDDGMSMKQQGDLLFEILGMYLPLCVLYVQIYIYKHISPLSIYTCIYTYIYMYI
jgi:hypothetical protein